MQPTYREENGKSKLITPVTDADYTLSSFDNGTIVRMNSDDPHTVTIPLYLPVGFGCEVVQYGAGQLEFIGQSGVSLFREGDPYNIRSKGQYAKVYLDSLLPDKMVISGNTESLAGLTYADFIQQQYDVADLSALADNDPVGLWTDNVGTADASSSGTARPTYKANAGDPYVEFDGVNDYLSFNLDEPLGDYSVCMVLEETNDTTDYNMYLDQGFYEGIEIYSAGTGRPVSSSDHGTGFSIAKPAVPTGFMGIYLSRKNDSARLRLNGVENSVASGGSTAPSTLGMTIGAGDGGIPTFAHIRVKRIIIFRVSLNATHFDALAADMLSEYGVTI